jgi:hypothetical protein
MEYRRIVNKAYDQGSYKSNTYFNLTNFVSEHLFVVVTSVVKLPCLNRFINDFNQNNLE